MTNLSEKRILAPFPGQGSQKIGMGLELFAKEQLARDYFNLADELLGFKLSELCFNGPEDQLTATAVAQPAVLTTSVIAYELWRRDAGAESLPVAAAGHSLGEYSALVAAGAISFADAVVLVHKRGKYMQNAVGAGQGKMLAVLGKTVTELEALIAEVHTGIVEIANINSPGQIVVAGDVPGVYRLVELLAGSKSIPLNVSAPFHCSLMQPAADNLQKDLSKINFSAAKFPVYANCTAASTSAPEIIAQNLYTQVCARVRWVECVENATTKENINEAIEFGYGNVLTGMLKRIKPELPRSNYP